MNTLTAPPIDPSVVGTEHPPHNVLVEAGRLRQFARATGAHEAGAVDRPVPPTFLFCLEMERPDPWAWLAEIGVDLATVLHAEQSFLHHRPAWAGERLTFVSRITDVTAKNGGALQFVVRQTRVTDELGALVAELSSTLAVVRRTGTEGEAR